MLGRSQAMGTNVEKEMEVNRCKSVTWVNFCGMDV